MHPTIAVGVAALTWLVVHNRSDTIQTLLGIAAFMLGWEPAAAGSHLGVVLIAVAAGAAAPVVCELVSATASALSRHRLRQEGRMVPNDRAARPARSERWDSVLQLRIDLVRRPSD